MNHKLRVLVRVNSEPGQVRLEVTGCLAGSDFPALTHLIRRAGRLRGETEVSIDLRGASHLDPEILLRLRGIADAATGLDGSGPLRFQLLEPAELPVCLLHVGADGEVLAGLAGGVVAACGRSPQELDTVNGLAPRAYFEGTLDPATTVRALSDAALVQLADALYRQLDTSSPPFGALTWYELAAEELQDRHGAAAVAPDGGSPVAPPRPDPTPAEAGLAP